jgi:hypothetical protein
VQLAGHTNKPLAPENLDKNHVTDRDTYAVKLPIHRMGYNVTEFFARFHYGLPAEFEVEYSLRLDETVHETHESCDRYGVKITEKGEGRLSGFFFARCIAEDRLLYINILKPLDRVFELEHTSRQLIETEKKPVIRVEIPQDKSIHRALVGEMKLSDERNTAASHYEIWLEPKHGLQRFYGNVGLAPGIVYYNESFARLSMSEAVLTAKGTLGWKIVPKLFDVAFSGYLTALPVVLRPNDKPGARFLGLNYRFGLNLPINELEATTFQVLTGWYDWHMLVPGNEYGINNIGGPQLYLAVTHAPLGDLGWSAYLKYAPMGDGLDGLNFSNLGRREMAFGGSHDVKWFGETKRRPALTLDVSLLDVVINTVIISSVSVSLGMSYPLF